MQASQSSGQYALSYRGRYYSFNKAQIVIGSDPRCDLIIENNPRVLPRHAWLTLLDGKVFLQYHDSAAAIWVNGMRVTEVQLQDRDEIAVGDPETKLTFLLNPPPISPRSTQAGATRAKPNNQAAVAQVSSNMGKAQTPTIPHPTPVAASVATLAPPAPSSDAPVGSTNATRYLCAAGHLSEDFQDYVMRNVVYEDHRAIGETYGVNMHAVVSWCKRGINRINVRDTVLLGLLLLIFLFVLIHVFQLIGAIISSSTQNNSQSNSLGGLGYNSSAAQMTAVGDAAILGSTLGLFGVLIFVYLIERLIKRRWPRTHPGFVSLIVLLILLGINTNPLLAFFLVLALPVTIFVELCSRYYGEATKRLSKGEFEKNLMPVPLDAGLKNKLQENFTQQRNVVAYSGFRPFAGAGDNLGGWSFVVDTTKGAQSELLGIGRDEPLPFTLSELYATVRQALEKQGLKDVLEIEEKLYVDGEHLSENPPFFNAVALRPVTSVDQSWIEHFREHPTEDVRYYQCIRFNFWRGEVIFTAFLRFVRRGKNLFAEIDYLVLYPLMEDYYWVDKKEIVPPASKVWQLIKRSFDAPIKHCFGVLERFLRGFSYQRQQQKLARIARNNPSFDYGAATSLRQFASDDKDHLFFQKLDRVMYLKIAEQELLEAIVRFLEQHHIDTTELRQRQQMILNNGTIVNNSGQIGFVQGAGSNVNSASFVGSQAPTPVKS